MRRRPSKKKNLISFIIVLFLCIGIGYAFLNATLNINGTAKIMDATWDIHFTNLRVTSGSVEIGTGDAAATIDSSNNTVISYTITFKEPGEFYEFMVDAKNFGTLDGMIESVNSKLNGVEISTTNPLPVYLDYSVTYSDGITIDSNHLLTAGSFVTYKVRLEYKRDIEISDLPSSVENQTLSFGITTIQSDSNAIIKPEWPVIGNPTMTNNTYRSNTYKDKIKTITLDDEINPPANPVESWDIGVAQNGNVMAYLTTNADDNTKYDLYIQGDGALYANPNSSYLFFNLTNVDSINNMDVLDTSKAANMRCMFQRTGYNSTVFTLNLGNKFDTSKVTDMSYMFTSTGYNSRVFTLDLGNKFNTSNVTDMESMFLQTGLMSTVFTLDLGNNFDTSKVINMSNMFAETGRSSTVFTLNLGNKFNTSNVTNMSAMFSYTSWSSTVFTLDLGSKFDTSNVNSMYYMFRNAGYNSPVFSLNLGNKFDTSKVTNMSEMFSYVGYSSNIFTLDLGPKFDTSNVENMASMFNQTGYSSVSFSLNLGNKFDTSKVTNMSWMFCKMGYSSTSFTLDLGDKFDTSSVINFSHMFYGVGHNSTDFTLDLGDKFDTSSATDMNYMFASLGFNNQLFTLDLGNKFDTSNVTDMSYMFFETGSSNPTFDIDLSTFDFSNVEEYDNIFGWFKVTQTIYVKDATAQNWIVTNSGNSNLTTNNVLIKGA